MHFSRAFAASFFAVAAVSGCATAPPAGGEAAAVTEGSEIAEAARIMLKAGDAPALDGVWNGRYRLQSGYSGRTRLTLTPAGPDSVDGVFEYFWGRGQYDRVPSSGSYTGTITSDGLLQFGDDSDAWQLVPVRVGDELEFTAREIFADQPAVLDWGRALGPLPSERQ